MKTFVYVVMGNDFPECVFAHKAHADAFVARRDDEGKVGKGHRRIYWRVYTFPIITEAEK